LKILFDQNTPRNLVRHLEGHQVLRAAQMGWEEIKNGDLLLAAEGEGFDVFLTCDRNLEYQQNLRGRKISIVTLTTNNWPLIKPHVERVKMAINAAVPGGYQVVDCGLFSKRKRVRELS